MDNFQVLDLTSVDVTATTQFPALPDGDYEIECVECTGKETKSGGFMWAATFSILDPEYHGKKLWHNFNVINKSEVAQTIARTEVKKLLTTKGVDVSKATPDNLVGIKVIAKVATKVDPGYGTKNVITQFLTEQTSERLPF